MKEEAEEVAEDVAMAEEAETKVKGAAEDVVAEEDGDVAEEPSWPMGLTLPMPPALLPIENGMPSQARIGGMSTKSENEGAPKTTKGLTCRLSER